MDCKIKSLLTFYVLIYSLRFLLMKAGKNYFQQQQNSSEMKNTESILTKPKHNTKTGPLLSRSLHLKTILKPTEVKQIVNKLNLFWNICWIRARCNWRCNDIDYWFPNCKSSSHGKWSPGGSWNFVITEKCIEFWGLTVFLELYELVVTILGRWMNMHSWTGAGKWRNTEWNKKVFWQEIV